jgi:hypothetical protein
MRGRVPATGEPAWTDVDRQEAVALVLEDWDTCPGCGQRLSESTREDAEGTYTITELQCSGCQVREAVAEKDGFRGRKIHVHKKNSVN